MNVLEEDPVACLASFNDDIVSLIKGFRTTDGYGLILLIDLLGQGFDFGTGVETWGTDQTERVLGSGLFLDLIKVNLSRANSILSHDLFDKDLSAANEPVRAHHFNQDHLL